MTKPTNSLADLLKQVERWSAYAKQGNTHKLRKQLQHETERQLMVLAENRQVSFSS